MPQPFCHFCNDFMAQPPENLWDDTRLQAVRLVAEIMATQDNLDMNALCESMGLQMNDLNDLIDRIDKDWEEAKLINCPS